MQRILFNPFFTFLFRPLVGKRGLSLTFLGMLFSLVVGTYNRIYLIENIPGVNGDEALMSVQLEELLAGRPTVLMQPTGRLLSPVYAVLVGLIVKIVEPGMWALRLPGLISGLFLLLVLFLSFKSALSFRERVGFFALAALHPVLIAYSRISIEQSLLPLATLFCLASSISGDWRKLLFALSFAVLVHPVGIFLAPLMGVAFLGKKYREFQHDKTKFIWIVGVVCCLLGLLFSLQMLVLPSKYLSLFSHTKMIRKLMFLEFPNFIFYFWKLVWGFSAFNQFSSQVPETLEKGILFISGGGFLWLCAFRISEWFKTKQFERLVFLVGWFLTVLFYYLVTGSEAIDSGVNRYALVLLLPTIFIVLLLLDFRTKQGTCTLFIILAIQVVSFNIYYFRNFQTSNSAAHETYLSGTTEPKKFVADYILSQRNRDLFQKTDIIVDSWWLYWPIKYFLIRHPTISVVSFDEEIRRGNEKILRDRFRTGAFVLGFIKSPLWSWIIANSNGRKFEPKRIRGYGDRDILMVLDSYNRF